MLPQAGRAVRAVRFGPPRFPQPSPLGTAAWAAATAAASGWQPQVRWTLVAAALGVFLYGVHGVFNGSSSFSPYHFVCLFTVVSVTEIHLFI